DFLTLAQQTYTLSRSFGRLEKQLADEKARVAELEGALRAHQCYLLEAQQKVGELDQSAQGWARECQALAAHAQHLDGLLRSMTSDRRWLMAQRLGRLRQRLAPPNSLRERCGRFLMRVQRRLRGAA